jgi:hypothetical protein
VLIEVAALAAWSYCRLEACVKCLSRWLPGFIIDTSAEPPEIKAGSGIRFRKEYVWRKTGCRQQWGSTGCHLFPNAGESHKTPDDLLLPTPVQPAGIVQIEFLAGAAWTEASLALCRV